jgi:hypothetical protein
VSGLGRYKSEASRARALANLRRGPAAPEGNRLAMKHGAYAQLTRAELGAEVAAMRDALGEDAPLLDAADAATLEDWAACRVHLRRAEADLRDHGWKDRATGAPRELAEYARRLRRDSLDYAREFGCTPRARAALGLDVARGFDLAQELARLDGDGGGG